ncbi:hypothetical protein H8D57_01985 [bacterium]|nr:hypothetical protein [bacterium]
MKYFIDFRFDDTVNQFLPIGIWIQDMDDQGIDMYYPDESLDEYEEAIWVMNRIVEKNLNVPPDFLEYHQAKAGYRGMRSQVFEKETDLNLVEFMRVTLQKILAGKG